ncbi:hypothetical protein PLESTB_000220500 [Pleodorina starrii]|uniref:Nudix hydrolase domain-containing protein n=1 Tax=Pleodorina starrii TaxID=330485 RepID=A0A9W6BCW2_9CHLO|nr:hypothetical protein PLESTM_001546200 [Pleodorina starrii]GLC49450.1 hypothetical protein PLESTB_000220500 [Pleodorina starrii]GLC75683.1 hypothetical protein PLESTF_001673500 [Pleodorina starrii]
MKAQLLHQREVCTSARCNPIAPFQQVHRRHAHHTSRPVTLRATRTPEYCVIVDEHNRVVGAEPRDDTVRNRLLGRGSYVLVTNDRGELLVSKRSANKDVYSGHWDVVIAGVVRAGEEYEDTAARELSEEIGVSEAAARAGLRRLFVFPYQDSSCHVWGCAFTFAHGGGQLRLQEEEVDWAGFRSWEQVDRMLSEERFTPVGKHILQLYRQEQQQG